MGQYYRALTENKKDGQRVWSIQTVEWRETVDRGEKDYGLYNGIKLTEHSWIGNDFMVGISEYLYKNPTHVAWVGDYSDTDAWGNVNSVDYRSLHERAWNTIEEVDAQKSNFDVRHKFLVNHTKKTFVDFDDYIEKSTTEDGWCLHPLSLLTACGNGLGGGDFHKTTTSIGNENVGRWGFDEISIEDEAPSGYTKEDITFKE